MTVQQQHEMPNEHNDVVCELRKNARQRHAGKPSESKAITRTKQTLIFKITICFIKNNSSFVLANAPVAKLVDALCSGRSAERRAGSSPVLGTTPYKKKPLTS